MAAPNCVLCGQPSTHKAPRTGNYFCEKCASMQGLKEEHRFITFKGVPIPMDQAVEVYPVPSPFDAFIPAFSVEVRKLVEGKADTKGYHRADDAKPGGLLQQFVESYFQGHSLGEIVYKAVRYQSKHDPEDLLKIAAWAYLLWANRSDYPMGVVDPVTNEYHAFRNQAADLQTGLTDGFDEVAALVKQEAIRAAQKHGYTGDPVRAAAIVVEEAGEAMKDALDATRASGLYPEVRIRDMVEELIQTAAVATAYAARFRR